MADAVHDLGDTISIGFAWILSKLSDKHPDEVFTYGYSRFSLLGALINGVVLVVGSIWVLSQAIPRLASPEMPNVQGMFWLAILGVLVNGFAAWKLSEGKTLNERVLNWHLLEDVLGWIAVLIVSITLLFYELPILDPILSIAFTMFIFINVLRSIVQTVKIFLQSTPNQELLSQIKLKLGSIDNVREIHHLHLWTLDGECHVLTAHLKIEQAINAMEQSKLKENINKKFSEFSLAHTTIEIEMPEEACRDSNDIEQ